MSTNRRKLFVNSRIRNFFIFYVLFSILIVMLFLGWELFIELFSSFFSTKSKYFQFSQGFPTVIKVSLLLLWGMFSFLLSYTYLDAKFLGIFSRFDTFFKSLIQNSNQELKLRCKDEFNFITESFNKMHGMFNDRINRRKLFIDNLQKTIENMPENTKEDEIKKIINDIEQELAR